MTCEADSIARKISFSVAFFSLFLFLGTFFYEFTILKERVVLLERENMNLDAQIQAQEELLIQIYEVMYAIEKRQESKSNFTKHF